MSDTVLLNPDNTGVAHLLDQFLEKLGFAMEEHYRKGLQPKFIYKTVGGTAQLDGSNNGVIVANEQPMAGRVWFIQSLIVCDAVNPQTASTAGTVTVLKGDMVPSFISATALIDAPSTSGVLVPNTGLLPYKDEPNTFVYEVKVLERLMAVCRGVVGTSGTVMMLARVLDYAIEDVEALES